MCVCVCVCVLQYTISLSLSLCVSVCVCRTPGYSAVRGTLPHRPGSDIVQQRPADQILLPQRTVAQHTQTLCTLIHTIVHYTLSLIHTHTYIVHTLFKNQECFTKTKSVFCYRRTMPVGQSFLGWPVKRSMAVSAPDSFIRLSMALVGRRLGGRERKVCSERGVKVLIDIGGMLPNHTYNYYTPHL